MATINKDFRIKSGLVVESGSITTPLTTAGLVLTNGSGVLSSTATIANSYLANSGIVFGSTTQALGSTITNIAGVTINSTTIPTSSTLLVSTNIGSTVQAYDADLAAIAALTETSGLLKKTAANTWSLDTTAYLTSAVTSIAAGSGLSGGTITGTGTIALATAFGDTVNPYASKTANQVLASPNGSAGVPTFRSLAANDIPTLNQNTTGSAGSVTNSLTLRADSGTTEGTDQYVFNGSSAKTLNLIAGTNITITKAAGSWTIAGAASGVTSVGLSLPNIFTVSNSPVTSTGTLTAVLASQTANQFLAAPNGSPGAPTFRAIVAADIPTLNQNTTGSAGSVVNALSVGATLAYTSGTTYDGSTARTIGLATAGTAGTYTKVTTDTFGRVTSGASLASGDIPDISATYLTVATAGTTYAPKANPIFTGTVTTPLTTAGIVLTNGSGALSSTATIADSYLATISTAGKVANSATTATNANTASAIVARDASGNFTAGTITATLSATSTLADGVVATTKSASNNSTAVATTAYVDAAVSASQTGLDVKASVRAATTTAGTLATSFANGQTIDGVVLATGNRILIKDQATGSENGIYTVNASGAPTRATDADTSAKVTAGMFTFIAEGTVNGNEGWVLTTDDTITLGTTALTFVQFSSAGSYTQGTGIAITGQSIAVDTAVVLTQTGSMSGITNKTFVAPVLGAATATSINNVTFTTPGSAATLTLVGGSTLATAGAFSTTLTSTAATNVTLPTTGTLATLAGSESLTNKKLGSLTTNGLVTTSGGDGTLSVTVPAAGILTFLTTPTSANFAAALSDESGTGTVAFTASPAFTGTPTSPTATAGTNTTQVATTAFVTTAVAGDGTGTRNVAAINYNNLARNVAGTASITGNTATTISGVGFATGTFSSAEYVVKTNYTTNSEVSKILVTINYPAAGAQPDVYITEYGNVQSNNSLSAITASVTGSTSNWTVNLVVTPTAVSGTTTVRVYGTLLSS